MFAIDLDTIHICRKHKKEKIRVPFEQTQKKQQQQRYKGMYYTV